MSRPITKLANIEQAAMELISQRGLAQVTIKEIAAEAGCAEGALYRHYASKDKMAWTLFSRETARFGDRLREVMQAETSYSDRIRAGVETFYLFYDEDPVTFRFILLAQHDFPQAHPLAPEVNPNDLVTGFITEGITSGEFQHSNPELATAMILGLVLQPATMHIYGRIKGSMKDHIDSVSQGCLKILGVHHE